MARLLGTEHGDLIWEALDELNYLDGWLGTWLKTGEDSAMIPQPLTRMQDSVRCVKAKLETAYFGDENG